MMRRTLPALVLLTGAIGCGDDFTDLDADGFPADVDCDDADETAFPGGEEVCDDVDNDCDGEVDNEPTDGTTWFYDADGDGYGSATFPATRTCDYTAPSGYVDNTDDCNDLSAEAYPGGVEVCDGLDNNCNGSVDDFALDPSLWYFDGDGDGYGDPSTSQQLCDPPSGWVDNGSDCDDSDAEVNPSQEWYIDADLDGYGNARYRLAACGEQEGFTEDATDCDDTDASINPGADELCNEVDDDCDEEIDEDSAADAITWYADTDADGYGSDATATPSCIAPSDYVDVGGDCDDGDDTLSPAIPDWCDDGIDNNCDGDVDLHCAINIEDADARIVGENAYDYFAGNISASGDYNGDGQADVAFGAYLNDDGGTSSGKGYLMLGPITGGDYSAGDAVVGVAGETSDYCGYNVSLTGDANDDGYDDLMVGAYLADLDDDTTNSGAAYLFYGPSTGDFTPDDADATITGVAYQDYVSQYEMEVIGDINDDGIDDVYVGSIYYDTDDYTNAGILAVYYGPLSGTLDLDGADVALVGDNNSRYVGYAGEFADIDGDGTLDGLFSQPNADTVYGVLGPLSGTLTAADASLSIASTDDDYTGGQIESGDMDGDGYLDLAIGAHLDDTYTEQAGQVIVMYGPLSGSMSTKDAGFSVFGHGSYPYMASPAYGFVVKDLDDDGSDDLFFGSPGNDLFASGAGAAYLFYGPMTGTTGNAVERTDLFLVGEDDNDAMGWGLDIADMDGDGTLDLVAGARAADVGYGVGYVLFGTGL